MRYLSRALIASSIVACATPAAATVVDFETATPGDKGTTLTIGDVTFGGPALYVDDFSLGHTLQICSYAGSLCTQPLTLSFSSPVSGLTFTYDGVNSSTAVLNVLLGFGAGGSQNFAFTPLANGGLIDLSGYSDIISASITSNDPGGLAYDNFTYNNSGVPEPATWAMMLLGFGGIGATMRRQRRPAKLTQLA